MSEQSDAGSPSPATNPMPGKTRTPRWVWIALVLSLSANLLVMGLLAGSLWRLRLADPLSVAGLGLPVRKLIDRLPADRRGPIAELVRERRIDAQRLRGELRTAREDVMTKLAAEPFDRAAFERAIGKLASTDATLRQNWLSAVPTIAERLTLEERQWLVRHRWQRGPHRWSNRD